MDAEPLRQRDEFLQGVVAVNLIPFTVGEALLDQMPAVACGVNDHIGGFGRHRAFQHGFQGIEIVVVLQEREVIDKQHEFQRIARQLVENLRNGTELILPDLHNAQTLTPQCVGNGLHCGGFSGAGIAGQKNVGRRLIFKQCLGVFEDYLSLRLIIHQL